MILKSSRAPANLHSDWLRLHLPVNKVEISEFFQASVKTGMPLDLSFGTSVWGALLGEAANPLIAHCRPDFLNAKSSNDACDMVSAQIIQILSSLHGRTLAALFLPATKCVPIDIWDGVIQALEFAREDGLILSTGLATGLEPQIALEVWQHRDAFDTVFLQTSDSAQEMISLASQRRALVATTLESHVPGTVCVRTVSTISDFENQ